MSEKPLSADKAPRRTTRELADSITERLTEGDIQGLAAQDEALQQKWDEEGLAEHWFSGVGADGLLFKISTDIPVPRRAGGEFPLPDLNVRILHGGAQIDVTIPGIARDEPYVTRSSGASHPLYDADLIRGELPEGLRTLVEVFGQRLGVRVEGPFSEEVKVHLGSSDDGAIAIGLGSAAKEVQQSLGEHAENT